MTNCTGPLKISRRQMLQVGGIGLFGLVVGWFWMRKLVDVEV